MSLSIYNILAVYVDTVAMGPPVPHNKAEPRVKFPNCPLLLAALHVSVHNHP